MPEILYRKWRPRSFRELAGQEHVATTLTNALASGRVAHAYLFSGPRGTGKTSTGRLLGKALNCTDRRSGEPCNECESCLSFLSGRAMDLIELDAASNRGIDEIRSLRDKVAFAPGAGEYKVYLIDEVHMLTDAAFNALLKTLEEPPPHVVFILATTEAHKLPATIASRCQRFDFRRVPVVAAVATLQHICDAEGITADPAALELIARNSTGSMRDAINLLDQLATSYGNDLSPEHVKAGLGLIGDERSGRLARLVLAGDLAGGLELIAGVRDDGLDLRQFQRELVDELRTLLLVKSGVEPPGGLPADRRHELGEASAGMTTTDLLTALRAFGEADLKTDPNSTLPLDIALAECILGRGAAEAPVTRRAEPATAAAGQPPVRAAVTSAPPAARPPAAPSPASSGISAPPTRGRDAWANPGAPPPEPPREQGYTWPSAPAAASPPASAQPVEPAAPSIEPETARPAASVEPPVSPPEPAGVGNNGRDEAESEPPQMPTLAGMPAPPSGLAFARSKMRVIFDALGKQSRPLAAMFGVCDIIEANETDLVLGFRFPNHMERAGDKTNRAILEAVISEAMGRPLALRMVHDANIEDWQQRDKVGGSHLVRMAQEMGARVLSGPEDYQ